MIFLSHNSKDKAIVEQFALRLANAVGRENIFYDSWSIKPGDGIIDKMNDGLADCQFFLFFVSRNSINSEMVKMEWQNAIVQKTMGKTRIVPIKLDNSVMPAILLQNLYINLSQNGLDVAIRQIMDLVNNVDPALSINPQFSNLQAIKYRENGKLIVECHANHYLEPIPKFLFFTNNNEKDFLDIRSDSDPLRIGFYENIELFNGVKANAYFIGFPENIVPNLPQRLILTPLNSRVNIDIICVRHQESQTKWVTIPLGERLIFVENFPQSMSGNFGY